jgi:hypothetical protein
LTGVVIVIAGGVESILITSVGDVLDQPASFVAVHVIGVPMVSPVTAVMEQPALRATGLEMVSITVVFTPTLGLTYHPFWPRVPLITAGPVITGGVVSTLIRGVEV